MDTLFKTFFGFCLGAVVVLGWNYYETAQAFQKGLVPTWGPAVSPSPATPVTPAATHIPQPEPAPSPVVESPTPVAPPAQPPVAELPETAEVVDPKIVALSGNPQLWPALVSLTKSFTMPIKDGARQIGEVLLHPGTSVGLLRVQANGKLIVRSQGQVFPIPASHTDVLERMLPDTGPYRAPVRALAPPPEDTPKPADETPPATSTEKKPAASGGSIFGVPIDSTQPTSTPQHPGVR